MKQAALALIIKDGLILSISRRSDPSKFGIIGGKVLENETLFHALIRETNEETSLAIRWADEFFHRTEASDGEKFECYCFYISEWKGEPKSNSEEGKLEWLTPEELTISKAAFPDYNAKMLEAFKARFSDVVVK